MSIHADTGASKAGRESLFAVEQRVRHQIARLDAVFLRGAGNHLQRAPGEPPEEMILVDSGPVFSAMRSIRLSARI
jgi:hypothetical protein